MAPAASARTWRNMAPPISAWPTRQTSQGAFGSPGGAQGSRENQGAPRGKVFPSTRLRLYVPEVDRDNLLLEIYRELGQVKQSLLDLKESNDSDHQRIFGELQKLEQKNEDVWVRYTDISRQNAEQNIVLEDLRARDIPRNTKLQIYMNTILSAINLLLQYISGKG